MQEKYNNVKVSELINILKPEGKHQKLIIVGLGVISFFQAFLSFSFSYLFYEPELRCINEEGNEYLCSSIDACKNEFGYKIYSGND